MSRALGAAAVTEALRCAAQPGPALIPFLTGGFPDAERYRALLPKISASADVLEIGVPFSDPMADGVTIQRSSEVALRGGASLRKILGDLRELAPELQSPVVLMSYYNPLLAYGLERLVSDARDSGVCSFIVPDLPLEECQPFRDLLAAAELALIQLVTPVTPAARVDRLVQASSGFLYVVTMTGTTGRELDAGEILSYLDRVSARADLPVCAGFGIRERSQVVQLRGHADGVIVGSALIEVLFRGEDPVAFIDGLRKSEESS